MNGLRTDVGNFRLKRKCSAIAGCSILVPTALLLLVSCVSGRPSDDGMFDGFSADEYSDVDNVEWHHVKIVDGVMQSEDHPVIFYKEDFVSEDYDPAKDKHKNASSTESNDVQRPRKYKEISRHHRYNRTESETYRTIKPEKIYFDVLPVAPVVVVDDSGANDSKFDTSKIRVEVMSLADEAPELDDAATKQILSKRPKKYRRRQRRDTAQLEPHRVVKRNPYYIQNDANSVLNFLKNIYGAVLQPKSSNRHAVKGNYWNPVSLPGPSPNSAVPMSVDDRFGDEDEQDVVYWPPARIPSATPQRRQPLPLWRDPSPENADTSFITTPRPQVPRRTMPPLIHDSNPANADASFATSRPPSVQAPTTRPRPQLTTPRPSFIATAATTTARPIQSTPVFISDCVWAIVQCCSRRSLSIRYQCFEAVGCYGAFWDLNPCADDIQDNALNYVNDYLSSDQLR